jgi:hypothetical protein
MYSQNDEERFIVDFFAGRTGRFLDIGAFDGVRFVPKEFAGKVAAYIAEEFIDAMEWSAKNQTRILASWIRTPKIGRKTAL